MFSKIKEVIAKTLVAAKRLPVFRRDAAHEKALWKNLQQVSLAEFRRLRTKKEQRSIEHFGLKHYLLRAGISVDPHRVSKIIFNTSIALNLLYSFYLLYTFSTSLGYTLAYVVVLMAVLWFLIFFVVLFLLWLGFHVILDIKILHRQVTIEEVLPDYLQLVSANIRAGVPIDQAMWLAVRPRFGILSKEIEHMAKQTMSGIDLEVALQDFGNKYDSVVLRRSINLLIEGMHAGGEVGDLLNKISLNIHEGQLLRKEIAASVTTYIIFITVASVIGAPLLFALSAQLLQTVGSLAVSTNIPSDVAGLGISFGKAGIAQNEFTIFALISLTMTSLFSSLIISVIKKGEAKSGFKYFPVFVAVAFLFYLAAVGGLRALFSVFF
ncbi:type II secretion system F family protein [Candidatus Woesearchaeota archaeon]|nr:type II secretion system F family protein [Candidatus Woesearchaeota archaeon]